MTDEKPERQRISQKREVTSPSIHRPTTRRFVLLTAMASGIASLVAGFYVLRNRLAGGTSDGDPGSDDASSGFRYGFSTYGVDGYGGPPDTE